MFADLLKLADARAIVPRLSRIAALTGVALALAVPALAHDAEATHSDWKSRGNAVTHWNAVATDALTPAQGTNPMAHSRTLAIVHAAIHDAVNAIERRYESYTPGIADVPGASVDAAVAAAAHDVLAVHVPAQAALIEEAYARALARVPEGNAKAAGIVIGQASAAANMLRREGDGSEAGALPVYVPKTGPGEYQFTPPFDFAAQPSWGRVKPFVIDPREHAVAGPDRLSSSEYARDLAFVKAIGGIDSRIRTQEQSTIAQFWYEDSTLGWNRIANTAIRQQRLDNWSAARALALVNFALADGFIAGFEAKYHFRFWRPETAIRAAAHGSKKPAKPYPEWKPLLITPPVPDYPSTHTVLGWAAAEVLIDVLGDRVRYEADSLTLPGVTREYKGFSAAAEENGLSRIYAGIHFARAVKDGRRQGRSVGRAVAEALPAVR
jgi:membrane-associated phospholipid phosphatase